MKQLLLSVVILLLASVYSAQLQLPYNISKTINPRDVEMGDMDGDGLDDIILPSQDKIAWSRNLGNGNFAVVEKLSINTNDYNFNAAPIDADADGDTDLLIKNFYYPNGIDVVYELLVVYNLGSLMFSEPTQIFVGEYFGLPIVYDFNNDGLEDFVVSGYHTILSYKNNGDGTFTQISAEGTISLQVYNYFLFDLDEDGIEDIITEDNSSERVYWYKGLGDGLFDGFDLLYQTAGDINDPWFQDMDSDGDLDLLFWQDLGDYDYEYDIAFNDGSFNYSNQTSVYLPGVGPYSLIHYTDWNNDGIDDIIIASASYMPTEFYEWDGQSLELQELGMQTDMEWYHEFDLDGDEFKDYVVSGSPLTNRVAIVEMTPNGIGEPVMIDRAIGAWSDEAVADLDGDGDLDLAVYSRLSTRLGWYENLGSEFSTFNIIEEFVFDDNTTVAFKAIDADGDGDQDLFVHMHDTNYVRWYKNMGNLTFETEDLYINPDFNHMEITDLNNDGWVELIWWENSTTSGCVWSVPNDLFSAQTNPFSLDEDWRSCIADDMDYDGDNDLVIVREDGSYTMHVTIYYNDGTQEIQNWPSDSDEFEGELFNTYEAYTIDYNNDQFRDVLITGSGNAVFLTDGNSITSVEEIDWGVIVSIPPNDYNSDGYLDMVVEIELEDYVFSQTETGDWLVHGLYFNTTPGTSINVYDFDQNGTLEMLSHNQEDFLLGHFGVYETVIPVPLETFIDVNADGNLDESDLDVSLFPIEVTGENSNFTFSSSQMVYLDDAIGEFVFAPIFDDDIWEITTGSSSIELIIEDESDIPTEPLLFGFAPIGETMAGTIGTTAIGWNCAENSFLSHTLVQNTGNTFLSGIVSLTYDDELLDIITISPEADSVVNGIIYWNIELMLPQTSLDFDVNFTHPGIEFIGQIADFHAEFFAWSSNVLLLMDDYDMDAEVTCAYDPNDKSVAPSGFGYQGYVLPATPLEYTIRFQNTGNDTATTVIIRDYLSPLLEFGTFNFLGSSHNAVVSVNEEGLSTFTMNNIMLPDSGANMMESMGYVKYTIEMNDNIQPGDEIENTAYIHFDLNPAIVTNTVHNTVFTCQWLYADVYVHYEDSLLWAPAGVVAYQWFLYGAAIENAITQTITPPAPGIYTCLVSFENGCESLSQNFYYLVDGLMESVNPNFISIYPNPSSEKVYWRSGSTILRITLFDLLGREVMHYQPERDAGSLDVSILHTGTYLLRLELDNNKNILKKIQVASSR